MTTTVTNGWVVVVFDVPGEDRKILRTTIESSPKAFDMLRHSYEDKSVCLSQLFAGICPQWKWYGDSTPNALAEVCRRFVGPEFQYPSDMGVWTDVVRMEDLVYPIEQLRWYEVLDAS